MDRLLGSQTPQRSRLGPLALSVGREGVAIDKHAAEQRAVTSRVFARGFRLLLLGRDLLNYRESQALEAKDNEVIFSKSWSEMNSFDVLLLLLSLQQNLANTGSNLATLEHC